MPTLHDAQPVDRTCRYGVTIAVPGAYMWRFWIEAEGPSLPGQEDDLILIMTPHAFETAREALLAADLWCAAHPDARSYLERRWAGRA